MVGRDERVLLCCFLVQFFFRLNDRDMLVNRHLDVECMKGGSKTVGKTNAPTRCKGARCKESVHTFKCLLCNQFVCVKHRFSADHDCDKATESLRPSASKQFKANAEDEHARDSGCCCF